jgi:hypothetical protein
MALRTSSQSGNWNSTSTWGGAAVPGAGDTVSIGAHTVTVSDTRIIGTSPNDATTKVIDMTSASSVLIVNGSLTVRGNIGFVTDSTLTLGAGGAVIWDASASGGTPVYCFVSAGFCKLNINGTSGSHCTMSAPDGFTFSLAQNYNALQISFCDFTRVASGQSTTGSGVGFSVTDCTFSSCGFINLASAQNNQTFIFNRNRFDGSGTDSFQLSLDTTPSGSNARELIGNSFDGAFTYFAIGVIGMRNYFGGGIDGVNSHPWGRLTLNLIKGTRADGQRLEGLCERNYFTSDGGGNPHFVEVRTSSADFTFSQNVIEAHDPDLIDMGDILICVENRFTPPFICVAKNNIVLRDSSAPVSSGTLVTLYNSGADVVTEFYHNTCNIDNPTSGSFVRRSPFATQEAGPGAAGNVAALKSNLVWGTSPGQGFVAERVNIHSTLDVIDPANADWNWTHNLSAGNNNRFYQAQQFSAPLWTAGDAIAAGVDVNQGAGDPQFYDQNRNLASWAQDRGYGTTYYDALAAIRSNTSRLDDLITYIFEGFRCGNANARNASHDGACAGAANFYKSTRTLAEIATHRVEVTTKFGV